MNYKSLSGFSALLWVLASLLPVQAAQQLGPYHWTEIERIVAVGDIHGALAEFQSLLIEAGITDSEQNWVAGETHFVAVGDYLDRGAQSRAVMDLLRRLQPQAKAAGGRVHALLGNHEVMNMTRDLRYVLPAEFASYADLEPQSTTETAGQPGFLGHQKAFSLDGEYGAWLSTLPFLVVLNETAFLHGGLSEELQGMSLDSVNQRAHQELSSVMKAQEALQKHGLIDARTDISESHDRANAFLASLEAPTEAPADPAPATDPEAPVRDPATVELLKAAALSLNDAIEGLPFSRDGPLWYRRTAMCHPYSEQQLTEALLEGLGATRVVIGHTPTTGRTIHSRMAGRVLSIDTGMNVGHYKGHPAALVISGDQLSAIYLDLALDEPSLQSNRTWPRPYGMDDEAIAEFLRTARVTLIEDVGIGVTKPRRVTLEANGKQMRAVFKTLDTDPNLERGRWGRLADKSDRFIYGRAAYELDQLLGLDLVPVAVTRSINNEPGLLQYWMEETINEKARKEQGIGYAGYCSPMSQFALMNAFDVLIHNDDRNLTNVLYTPSDWALWLIDHNRAFRSSKKMPEYLKKGHFDISPQLREALLRLDKEGLAPLGKYLHKKQLQGIESRAKVLLKMR